MSIVTLLLLKVHYCLIYVENSIFACSRIPVFEVSDTSGRRPHITPCKHSFVSTYGVGPINSKLKYVPVFEGFLGLTDGLDKGELLRIVEH